MNLKASALCFSLKWNCHENGPKYRAKRSESELHILNVENRKCQVPKSPFLADVCKGAKAVLSFLVAPTFSLELRTGLYSRCTSAAPNAKGGGPCPHWSLEEQMLKNGWTFPPGSRSGPYHRVGGTLSLSLLWAGRSIARVEQPHFQPVKILLSGGNFC